MKHTIWIPGNPKAKGSYTPIRLANGGTFLKSPKASVDWQKTVRSYALQHYPGPATDRGVCIELAFFFARPKVHYRTGRYATILKPSAPLGGHCGKPDLDKLVRAVCDGLTGVVYVDDCQVHRIEAEKSWADTCDPGVRVTIL